jgi:hypothetical protein
MPPKVGKTASASMIMAVVMTVMNAYVPQAQAQVEIAPVSNRRLSTGQCSCPGGHVSPLPNCGY